MILVLDYMDIDLSQLLAFFRLFAVIGVAIGVLVSGGQVFGCVLPLLFLPPEIIPVFVINKFLLFHFLEI